MADGEWVRDARLKASPWVLGFGTDLRSTCEGRLEVIALKKCFKVPFPGGLGGLWGLPPGLAPLGLEPGGTPPPCPPC